MAVAEQALTQMQDFQLLQKQLEAVKKQNIAVLGDGQVFVKRTANGMIRSVKGSVTLSEQSGDIAYIYPKTMTTSKGFNKANQIAGLSIITPEKLQLPNGDIVVNPFPMVEPRSGSIGKVWVKKMAIGYSPTGVLVVTSATLLYDVRMYFVQDVLKKVGKVAAAGTLTMEFGLNIVKETEYGIFVDSGDPKRPQAFIRIDDSGLGILIELSHPDIIKAVETYVQKKLFAERNAQSIAERLVMSKHPALSNIAYVEATGPDKAKVAKVPVVGFVHDFNQDQLLDIAKQAEQGGEIVVNGQKAQVIDAGVIEASAEEMMAERDDEEVVHEAQVVDATVTPVPDAQPVKPVTQFSTGGGLW
ncbi:hypothetical protein GJ688_01895 [Heliobacillus mobilis]|uniref:Uncharacterized protein n=1 Tax=Heliobacterium mobile TaxID=28064 RepID=A0A6I3SG42_HELMO|nr:hypothetical protein [Heliobacterium mobile]MTV47734.1 hypothetical protein [Heliobacterium mobile]